MSAAITKTSKLTHSMWSAGVIPGIFRLIISLVTDWQYVTATLIQCCDLRITHTSRLRLEGGFCLIIAAAFASSSFGLGTILVSTSWRSRFWVPTVDESARGMVSSTTSTAYSDEFRAMWLRPRALMRMAAIDPRKFVS